MNYLKFIFIFWFIYIPLSFADQVKVGTLYFYPPFVMSLQEGFDIDLIQTLCRRTHHDCQLIPMDLNKLFSALDDGSIDIAIGGLVITEDRLNRFISTTPYLLSRGTFMVSKQSTIETLNDLDKKSVGVMKGGQDGGVFYNYLKAHYLGQFDVVSFNGIGDILNALSNNKISAAFVHESTALYWVQNGGGQFKIIGTPTLVGEGMGIFALPKNSDLINQFNQQLYELENDDYYLNLYQTYFSEEKT
ncbi:transporter substrate-binding domain-containing protein [Legionella impletisoli]|uniref:Arginine ABC transporter substrate-binding protein n=1 Tax=Legionella impletisoli TaxID=343510 RepID=A0A917N919_9GAMM|nr:transporter substrate-binding domain-containing protein [Legionella impletisoli]GGI79514.1 arginine ABC transporter substrate-binding protein [Legionella impletisoli]